MLLLIAVTVEHCAFPDKFDSETACSDLVFDGDAEGENLDSSATRSNVPGEGWPPCAALTFKFSLGFVCKLMQTKKKKN